MAKKQEYFKITSKSDKTTSFSPADLQIDDMGDQAIITIPGMLPKANPRMLEPVYTYINRAEKDALFKEPSFMIMQKKGIYEAEPVAFSEMPDEYQIKYNRKMYNQLQAKKS